MSSKIRRLSGGSNTYSSNRKRHIRDLSASSNDDQADNRSEGQASDVETDQKKKVKAETSKQPNDDASESEQEKEYEVETIKAHRQHGKTIHYRVGWKGYASEDDSWEPPKNLTGAHELLKKYKAEHNLDTKTRNGRVSNVSTKSASKKTDPDHSEGSGEDDNATSLKRKRASQDKPKSSIAPLRKNGVTGPTKADRASVANRKTIQRDCDVSEDGDQSADEDEWHARHKKIASWEDLIRSVRTVEKPSIEGEEHSPSSASDTINVCLLWKTGRTTWVSNKTARAKVPLKLLDFYEAVSNSRLRFIDFPLD